MNDLLFKIKNNSFFNFIKPYLKNYNAYIIGGFIRDAFMDIESYDIDIIISEVNVKNFSFDLANKINAHFVELDSQNSIYRLILENKKNYIDITKPIDNNFEKDIKRRDLTINAIAFDVNNESIIDIVGGISDIKNKIIKGISNKNFEDDPLRLLRIFRFAATTGFNIDSELIKLTKNLAPSINNIALERINAELVKMFEGKYTHNALIQMDETGLLTEILPIFNDVKKIPSNTHHHLDLIHHLIETVNQIQLIYNKKYPSFGNQFSQKTKDALIQHFESYNENGVKNIALLKLAGFLHDIGKPSCWTIEEDRHRFIKHDEIGSELCLSILKKLKFSKKQIDYIKTLIKYHIYPSSMVCATDVNEKAFMRFYRKMEGYVIDVIILAIADRLSSRGVMVTDDMVANNINALTKLLNNYINIKDSIKPLPKLLDGYEIMNILKIPQSKKIGDIICALKEAQLSQNINTKEEAINFVKNFN